MGLNDVCSGDEAEQAKRKLTQIWQHLAFAKTRQIAARLLGCLQLLDNLQKSAHG
jgi:hypothetical protein